ncbi:hypothetical protein KOW79_014013 [Hemibagrus wyckioides]|uniref:Uncharacterized protein n=1 Tax=Hemibagrus wyckioides TaxID=337641 RepID=A0A9D3NKT7_9TELE|nr:hypothetical protein KOW79_014013 [Hemibagrus wyckioides]
MATVTSFHYEDEEDSLKSTPPSSNGARQRGLLQNSEQVFQNDRNCSLVANSQHSRVLCYADDARSLCAQIKALVNSDPQACHQQIEILSRSRVERPKERTGDGEASALKIRHETPFAACFQGNMSED